MSKMNDLDVCRSLLNIIDEMYESDGITPIMPAPDPREACHSKTHDCATLVIHPKWGEGKPVYESHAVPTDEGYVAWYDVEFDHGIEKEVPAEDMEIITLAEHGVTASKEYKNDTKLMAGKLKDVIIDAMQMSREEFDAEYKGSFDYEELNKTYNEEHPEYVPSDAYESAPFGEPSREEEQYNTLITAYENGEEDLAEVLGLSMQELDQEMTEFAMDHNLHMDDDRDEVAQGYIEQVCDNADYKDHGEPEMAQEHIDALEELKKMAGLI